MNDHPGVNRAVVLLILSALIFSFPIFAREVIQPIQQQEQNLSPFPDDVKIVSIPEKNQAINQFDLNPSNNELDEILWQEDWENGLREWVFAGTDCTGITHWQTSDWESLDGDNWRCFDEDLGNNGGYHNHWLQWMVTPVIDLTEAEIGMLEFDMRLVCEPPAEPFPDFDGWDGAAVWVSGDGGISWESLYPDEGPEYNMDSCFAFGRYTDGQGWGMGFGIPAWGDPELFAEWAHVEMSLTDYEGEEEVMIAFGFASDLAASTGEGGLYADWTGFQLDNIEVLDGVNVLFSDDADGNNVGGDFSMYSGNYIIWGLDEDENAPSPEYKIGMENWSQNFGQVIEYTGEIDLSEIEDGRTLLDVMLIGDWTYVNTNPPFTWTMQVKPVDEEEWYYASNPWGEGEDDDVYDEAPDEWEWFSVEFDEVWDLSDYHGEVLQVRFVIYGPNIYPTVDTDRYLFFDDLTVLQPDPPTEFSLMSPEDEEVLNTASPTLEWEESTDPDEGDITYVIYYGIEADFADADSVTGIEFAIYTFDEELTASLIERADERRESQELDEFDDDITVYWKVRAQDDNTFGTWSTPAEGWSFDIYLFDPPGEFRLSSPRDNDAVVEREVTFTWRPSEDPDPGDEITYTWYLAFNEELTDALTAETGTDTFFTYAEFQDDSEYFWAVHAQDTNTEGLFSDIYGFNTSFPDPPTDFSLLEPENGAALTLEEPFDVQLSWEESTDPDPNQMVEYVLYFHATVGDLDTTISIPVNDNLQRTVNLPRELEVEGWETMLSVEWWVVAISRGDEVECQERFTFTVNSTGIEENAFTGIPTEFSVASVYPNPFNPVVSVMVGLPFTSNLNVTAFDVLGREIAVLADNNFTEGYHRITFDGSHLSSGIYFIRATVPGKMNEIKKVVLAR